MRRLNSLGPRALRACANARLARFSCYPKLMLVWIRIIYGISSTRLCTMKIYTMILNLRRRHERRSRMLQVIPPGLEIEFTSDWSVDFDWRNGSRYLDEFGLFPWKI